MSAWTSLNITITLQSKNDETEQLRSLIRKFPEGSEGPLSFNIWSTNIGITEGEKLYLLHAFGNLRDFGDSYDHICRIEKFVQKEIPEIRGELMHAGHSDAYCEILYTLDEFGTSLITYDYGKIQVFKLMRYKDL